MLCNSPHPASLCSATFPRNRGKAFLLTISLNHSTLQVQVILYTAKREPSPDPGGRCRVEGVTDEGVHAFMQQPFPY